MEQNQKIERMKALIATLNAASQAYYQESRELMPNHAYDALYDELAALEAEPGMTLSQSPTQRVGYAVLSQLLRDLYLQRVHAPFFIGGQLGKLLLCRRILQLQKRPRVPLRKSLVADDIARCSVQSKQAQQIVQRGRTAPHGGGERLLRHAVLGQNALQRLGLIQKMQVFALYVFNQRDQRAIQIICAQHDCVRSGGVQALQGAQAALARDQFVFSRAASAHQQRRKQPESPDRLRKIADSLFIKFRSRLVFPAYNAI